jgi:hypothetical protein
MRLPPIVITIADDVLGKPYLTIEGDPERMEDIRDIAPIKLTLWADSIRVDDIRRKKD